MTSSDDADNKVIEWEKPAWAKEGPKLKPTGKGSIIRKGVSLAGPITSVNAQKDPTRDMHPEARKELLKQAQYDSQGKLKTETTIFDEVKLKRTTTNERQTKNSSEFDPPKLRSRSKSPVPQLPKNTTRSRSPVPDQTSNKENPALGKKVAAPSSPKRKVPPAPEDSLPTKGELHHADPIGAKSSELETAVRALQNKLQSQDSGIIETMLQQLKVLSSDNTSLSEQIKELQKDSKAETPCERPACQEAVQKLEQANVELRTNNEHLKQKLEAVQAENDNFRDELEEKRISLTSMEQQLNGMAHENEKTRNSYNELNLELEETKRGYQESQQKVQNTQAERDVFLDQLDKVNMQNARSIQVATDESNTVLQETNTKLTVLRERCKKAEEKMASMEYELMQKINGKDERIRELHQQNESILSEKEEIKDQLEKTLQKCETMRKAMEAVLSEKGASQDSIASLQAEAAALKQKYQEVRGTLQMVENERDEAFSDLEKARTEGNEMLKLAELENSECLLETKAKIATLEKALSKIEESKRNLQTEYTEEAEAQQKTIQSLIQQRDSLSIELKQSSTEKEALAVTCSEQGHELEKTKQQLEEAQDQLLLLTEEAETLYKKLDHTMDKCRAAVFATEEMKTLLEDDEKRISSLQKATQQLELEKANLSTELMKATASREEELPKDGSGHRLSLEIDPDDLLRSMNMPTDLGDSLSYLGGDPTGSSMMHRRSSIRALEELEYDLKHFLSNSKGVISGRASTIRASLIGSFGRSRQSSVIGSSNRQMSLLSKQDQRESTEEKLLSEIRDT